MQFHCELVYSCMDCSSRYFTSIWNCIVAAIENGSFDISERQVPTNKARTDEHFPV